jgi:hypothetical protein
MQAQESTGNHSGPKIIIQTICFFFVLLFMYAAASKLLDYQKFIVQLGKSPLLTNFAGWIGWLIPTLEITISLMLVWPRWQLAGLYASLGLMVMFTTYIIVITHFGDYIPCSCGGVLQNLTWTSHLIFNSVFVLLALLALTMSGEKIKTQKNILLQ